MTPKYIDKLSDKRWKEKREQILQRDGYACIICGKKDTKFNVHHKQYHYYKKEDKHADPWDYDNRYLITLCEQCHQRGHAKFEVPMKYI